MYYAKVLDRGIRKFTAKATTARESGHLLSDGCTYISKGVELVNFKGITSVVVEDNFSNHSKIKKTAELSFTIEESGVVRVPFSFLPWNDSGLKRIKYKCKLPPKFGDAEVYFTNDKATKVVSSTAMTYESTSNSLEMDVAVKGIYGALANLNPSSSYMTSTMQSNLDLFFPSSTTLSNKSFARAFYDSGMRGTAVAVFPENLFEPVYPKNFTFAQSFKVKGDTVLFPLGTKLGNFFDVRPDGKLKLAYHRKNPWNKTPPYVLIQTNGGDRSNEILVSTNILDVAEGDNLNAAFFNSFVRLKAMSVDYFPKYREHTSDSDEISLVTLPGGRYAAITETKNAPVTVTVQSSNSIPLASYLS